MMENQVEFDASEFSNEEAPKELSMAEMDALVKRVVDTKREKERQDKIASAAEAAYAEARTAALRALVAAGKKNYQVEGLGLVSVTNILNFTTPKTITDKQKLFDYIAEAHGDDTLMGLLSINAQTLGSFCRKEVEAAKDPGFQVPGIGAPTSEQRLSLREEKKA